MTPRRPRRRIEIYFVLYLVALVLLLPDRDRSGSGSDDLAVISTDIRLELRPERLLLTCDLERDSLGRVHLVSVDSMNVIRYDGDLTDVTMRARIEDDRTGQVITIEPGEDPGALFQIVQQQQRGAYAFYWRPQMADISEHKFRVTILGSGIPLSDDGPNGGDGSPLPSGLRVRGTTQFVLETHVEQANEAMLADGGSRRDTIVIQPASADGRTPGQFWVAAAATTIQVGPGAQWTNRLSFGGAEPMRDLNGLPRVTVNRAGVQVERYLDSTQQAVILRGRALSSGSYTVSIRAERDDGEIRETQFEVEALKVERPKVPSTIYPEIAYKVDPRLPETPDAKASARIGDRVIATATDGPLEFTVAQADEGKTVVIERSVNGDRVEAGIQIPISPLPAPEIRDVRSVGSGNVKRVTVLFHGDRKKGRPTLDILGGNAKDVRKLFGNLRSADGNDPAGYRWLEDFEVTRKDPNAPFEFKLRAQDGRGRYSEDWSED